MPTQQIQWSSVTPIVASDFVTYPRSVLVYIGTGGNLRVLTAGGDDVTFTGLLSGTFLPVHVIKVYQTGTTATGLVATTAESVSQSLLLDTYPATAAYSLRKIRADYFGAAIRVRRDSDNTEQDIAFNGVDLDTAALTSFCTGTNGFVVTWYDQQGSNNATQATAGAQPKIYDSSTGIVLENGRPALTFDGTDDYLNTTYAPSLGTASDVSYYLTTVVKANATHQGRLWSSQSVLFTPSKIIHMRYENTQYRSFTRDSDLVGLSALGGTTNLNQINFASLVNNGTANVYINGNSEVSVSSSFTGDLNNLFAFRIGALIQNAGNTDFLNANLQELVFYASDQSANRTAIENNINSYYNIYP